MIIILNIHLRFGVNNKGAATIIQQGCIIWSKVTVKKTFIMLQKIY